MDNETELCAECDADFDYSPQSDEYPEVCESCYTQLMSSDLTRGFSPRSC